MDGVERVAAQLGINMAGTKTTWTGADVDDYIASRATEQQYDDCQELIALMKKVTKQSPKMWGPSIIGFGAYKYTYDSGHTGEAPLAGFAIRGRELVVYLMHAQESLLEKLGPHKMGKSCLHIKRLGDIDKSVLQKLVAGCIAETKRLYK